MFQNICELDAAAFSGKLHERASSRSNPFPNACQYFDGLRAYRSHELILNPFADLVPLTFGEGCFFSKLSHRIK